MMFAILFTLTTVGTRAQQPSAKDAPGQLAEHMLAQDRKNPHDRNAVAFAGNQLVIATSLFGKNSGNTVVATNNLAIAYAFKGQLDEAERLLVGLEKQSRSNRKLSKKYRALTLNNFAFVLTRKGEQKRATTTLGALKRVIGANAQDCSNFPSRATLNKSKSSASL